jgi:hypothetical protein
VPLPEQNVYSISVSPTEGKIGHEPPAT